MHRFLNQYVVGEWQLVETASAVLWALTAIVLIISAFRLRSRRPDRMEIVLWCLLLSLLAFFRENNVHLNLVETASSVFSVPGNASVGAPQRIVATLACATFIAIMLYTITRLPYWYRSVISVAPPFYRWTLATMIVLTLISMTQDVGGFFEPLVADSIEETTELVLAIGALAMALRHALTSPSFTRHA